MALSSTISTSSLSLSASPPTKHRIFLSSSHSAFRFNPYYPSNSILNTYAQFRIHHRNPLPRAKPTSKDKDWKHYNLAAAMQDMDKERRDFSREGDAAGITTPEHGNKNIEGVIAAFLMFVQISSPLPLLGWEPFSTPPANAVLYSPDTKVPRTGELALRKAIPANPNMKAIQTSLEDISYLLRIPQRKPYGTMEGNVKKALKIATDEKNSVLTSIPADLQDKGSSLYASLIDGKGGLQALLQNIKDKDPDKVSLSLASSLDTIADIELLQAPGLSFLLPAQYKDYPRLNGRGIVELTIEKGDGSAFSPESGGELRKTAKIQVTVDGYSAPLTAGNFAKLLMGHTTEQSLT
ncbi:Peptidyl-prolyl cis-trans isomerase CYP37, chloroplastic [Linum perenne]